MREAWVKWGGAVCSYCDESLGISVSWAGPGKLAARRGWHIVDGELVYARPHRREARGRGPAETRATENMLMEAPPSPIVVVCRNRDCGERIILPTGMGT